MNPQELVAKINQERDATVRIRISSGDTVDLPPGAWASYDRFGTIHLHWPSDDPQQPDLVSRFMTLWIMSVASTKLVHPEAA